MSSKAWETVSEMKLVKVIIQSAWAFTVTGVGWSSRPRGVSFSYLAPPGHLVAKGKEDQRANTSAGTRESIWGVCMPSSALTSSGLQGLDFNGSSQKTPEFSFRGASQWFALRTLNPPATHLLPTPLPCLLLGRLSSKLNKEYEYHRSLMPEIVI